MFLLRSIKLTTLVLFVLGCSIGFTAESDSGAEAQKSKEKEDKKRKQKMAGEKAQLTDLHKRFDNVQSRLQEVEDLLEEWGAVSISGPILEAPNESYKLDFDLERSAKDYFKEAKSEVQGQAANFDQFSMLSGLGVKAQVDPVLAAEYARDLLNFRKDNRAFQNREKFLSDAAITQYNADIEAATTPEEREQAVKNLSANMPGPSTRPTAPVFDESRRVNVDDDLAPNSDKALSMLAGGGKFKDFQGLLQQISPNRTPTTSNRSALITAAGDRATQALFRILGNPMKGMVKDKNRQLYFAVTMVSVNPGWRTRKNYSAELWGKLRARYTLTKKGLRKVACSMLKKDTATTAAQYLTSEAKEMLNYHLSNSAHEISKRLKVANHNKKEQEKKIIELKAKIQTFAGSNDLEKLSKLKSLDAEKKDLAKQELKIQCLNNCIENKSKIDVKEIPTLAYKDIVVSAVSPMTDVQNLDLASSQRSLVTFALSIAGAMRSAGAKGQAKFFSQMAKSIQKDVRTATPDASVNAFAHPNGVFGFQIGPKLKALEDTGNGKDKPANVLGRQTFPVLLLISLPKMPLGLTSVEGLQPSDVNIELEMSMSTQWLPLKKGWWMFRRPRQRKEKLWSDAAFRILQCETELEWFKEKYQTSKDQKASRFTQYVSNAIDRLQHRIDLLSTRVISSKLTMQLPKSPAPAPIQSASEVKKIGFPNWSLITPSIVRGLPTLTDTTYNVSIFGSSLDGIDTTKVTLAENTSQPSVAIKVMFPSDKSIHFKLSVPKEFTKGTLTLKMPYKKKVIDKFDIPAGSALVAPIPITLILKSTSPTLSIKRTHINKPVKGGSKPTSNGKAENGVKEKEDKKTSTNTQPKAETLEIDELIFSKGIPAEVVTAEIEKKKADANQSNGENSGVDVDVRIDGNDNFKKNNQ